MYIRNPGCKEEFNIFLFGYCELYHITLWHLRQLAAVSCNNIVI